MDNVINNPITGKTKFTVTDDGVFNAITGRQVGVIVDGMVVSPVSGQPFAIVVQNSEGGVDLSFITAAASDILSGKVGADSSGNPVTGTIPKKIRRNLYTEYSRSDHCRRDVSFGQADHQRRCKLAPGKHQKRSFNI